MWFGAFLIFVAVPLLELALLIKVGQSIGFWSTMGIIVLTAALGIAVMRAHGIKAMQRAQESLAEGKTPVQSVVDGTFVLFAGLLLISPGLITDLLGLLLLIPPLRRVIGNWCMSRLLASGKVHTWTSQTTERQTPDGYSRTTESHERFESRTSSDSAEPNSKEPGPKRWTTRGPGPRAADPKSTPIIEGEFKRLDEKTVDPKSRNDGR
jgi:UPF0716 protein FxsA